MKYKIKQNVYSNTVGNIINLLKYNYYGIRKIKPVATIVAQFAAGVEVECIQHEGKMYMPVIGGDFDTTDSGKKSEGDAPKKPAPKPSKEEPADEKPIPKMN